MRNLATIILAGCFALTVLGMVTLQAPQMRREAIQAVQTKGVVIREMHYQGLGREVQEAGGRPLRLAQPPPLTPPCSPT